jgi:hypothetical protein
MSEENPEHQIIISNIGPNPLEFYDGERLVATLPAGRSCTGYVRSPEQALHFEGERIVLR